MKVEGYFTRENADLKVRSWLEDIDRKRVWKDGPGKSALLVLDMQRYFLAPSSHAFLPSSGVVLEKIQWLLKRFEDPVFFTKHQNKRDDGNLMSVWWKDVISGEMAEIVPGIDISRGPLIEKQHYSSFHGTPLEGMLREEGISSVIISGVMTDLCCETTARDAFMRGFKVFFLADCTATATEKRHISTLEIVSRGFGEVLTSQELMLRS